MRLFLALIPSKPIIKQLSQLQLTLNPFIPNALWVSKENLHLTLVFLGNINKRKLENLTTALKKSASHSPAITLKPHDLLFYPNKKNPSVLCIKITDTTKPNLENLRRNIKEELEKINIYYGKDKPPHLTIARFKKGITIKNAYQIKKQTNINLPLWTNWHFCLIQSSLFLKGAKYTILQQYQFKN